MRKRVGIALVMSFVLPAAGLVLMMTRTVGDLSRPAGLALYGLGWVAFAFAVKRHRRLLVKIERGKRKAVAPLAQHAQPLLALVSLLTAGAVGFTLVPIDNAEFVGMEPQVLRSRIDDDFDAVRHYRQGLARLVQEHTASLSEIDHGASVEQKRQLVSVWTSYLDYALALHELVDRHKYFYQINPSRHADLNTRSFLIGYSALVSLMRHTAQWRAAVDGNGTIESLLDDPRPELGVGKASYRKLVQQLTDAKNLLRVNAGLAHLQFIKRTGALSSTPEQQLLRATEGDFKKLFKQLGKKPDVFVDNPLDYFESKAFIAWFPVQRGIAKSMGNTRATRRENFVSVEQLQRARQELEPGDILLERRNWYLTNVGLPGFWPHAALYTGTPAEMDAFFGTKARAATGGLAPSQYLAEHFPELLRSYDEHDTEGHRKRVIEAIAHGVVLTSLEHSGNADYLGVLRPKLGKAQRLAALLRAFRYHLRPYDYNFDFATDAAVVCSELVYKAYQAPEPAEGLSFELVETGGRWVLPPNEIARKLDLEYGREDSELALVLFFDGSEERQRAQRRDIDAFRLTWQRPKWDIAQY